MDCKGVKRVIFLYVDNEMGEELHLALEEHVAMCPHCAERIANAQRLVTLVRRRCLRVRAPERLRRRILISLERQGIDLSN